MDDPQYPFVAMDAYFNTFDKRGEERVVKVHEYPEAHGDSIEMQDARKWIVLPTVIITKDGTQEQIPVVLSLPELEAIVKQVEKIKEDRNWNV
jgi:hypothetical protein